MLEWSIKKIKKELPEGAVYCCYCGVDQRPRKDAPRMRCNGQGMAIKRGRTWTARVVYGWTDEGRAKCRTKGGFATKRDALAYCPMLLARPEERAMTLQDYYDMWSKSARVQMSKS